MLNNDTSDLTPPSLVRFGPKPVNWSTVTEASKMCINGTLLLGDHPNTEITFVHVRDVQDEDVLSKALSGQWPNLATLRVDEFTPLTVLCDALQSGYCNKLETLVVSCWTGSEVTNLAKILARPTTCPKLHQLQLCGYNISNTHTEEIKLTRPLLDVRVVCHDRVDCSICGL